MDILRLFLRAMSQTPYLHPIKGWAEHPGECREGKYSAASREVPARSELD